MRAWDMRPYAPQNRCMKVFTGHQHSFERNSLRCDWSPDGSKVPTPLLSPPSPKSSTLGASDCDVIIGSCTHLYTHRPCVLHSHHTVGRHSGSSLLLSDAGSLQHWQHVTSLWHAFTIHVLSHGATAVWQLPALALHRASAKLLQSSGCMALSHASIDSPGGRVTGHARAGDRRQRGQDGLCVGGGFQAAHV